MSHPEPKWIKGRTKMAPSSGEYFGWDGVVKWLIDADTPEEIKITRELAARGQIESAILWFLEGDVASIHSLSIAAQELLHSLGKKQGKPSHIVTYWEQQPRKFRDQAKLPQNFFKHAHKDPKSVLTYAPIAGTMTLVDACMCFNGIYQKISPLMRLFGIRVALEHPDILKPGLDAGFFLKGAKVDDIAHLCRSEFLIEVVARFVKKLNPSPD